MRIQPTNFVSLPPPEEAIQSAIALASLDLPNTPYEEVLRMTWSLFPVLPLPCGKFPQGLPLYRARLCSPFSRFLRTVDLGAPPADSIPRMGRLNRPHQRIFYAAGSQDTAILETIPSHGKGQLWWSGHLTLGRWRLKREVALALVYFTEPALRRPDIQAVAFHQHALRQKHTFAFNLDEKDAMASAMIIEMHIASAFARGKITSPDEYKLSVAYAERLLCKDSEGFIDGIIYPSVGAVYSSDNVALRMEIAENDLDLVDALLLSYVNRGGMGEVEVHMLAKGKPDGAAISWDS